MKLFERVGIVGVGLIGGAIGMAIKKKGIAGEVVGVCRRIENITQAKKLKAIDKGFLNLDGIKNCDLVVLATSIGHIIQTIPKLNKFLGKGCIVIDVGSTKSEIIKVVEEKLSKDICFIGTHPLAGSEKKGVGFSSADLFNNSLCLVTPPKKSNKIALVKIKKLWNKLGAEIKIISFLEHDQLISFTSHLPHIVAFSLIDCLPKKALRVIAGSFKDATRIAQSDPVVWQDILLTNDKNILNAISVLEVSLKKFKILIAKRDKKSIARLIRRIKEKRSAF